MLYIATDIQQIKYGLLMELYEEDLITIARKVHGHLSVNEGLFEVEQDFYGYLRDVFFETKGAYYAFWIVDGKYCAGLRLEPWKDGLVLCGVCTKPDCRRKGYAQTLIMEVLGQLPSGVPVYSHVDKNNAPSMALHYKCGFQIYAEEAQMLDGSFLHNFCTFIHGK